MYKRLGRILGLAVVLAGVTSLAAYDLAASSVEGKVVEIDSAANRVVVESSTGERVTLMADPQTVILQGNDSKRLADLHTGDSVKVSYTTAGSVNTATDIDFVMMPSARTDSAQNAPRPATDMGRTDTYAQNTPTTPSDSAYKSSDRLPQTGSSLPLVGLAGLLLLGLGIAIRIVRMNLA